MAFHNGGLCISVDEVRKRFLLAITFDSFQHAHAHTRVLKIPGFKCYFSCELGTDCGVILQGTPGSLPPVLNLNVSASVCEYKYTETHRPLE